jgi:hypothetical protein
LIFSHGLHQKVLSGQKSETRRPIQADETHCRYRVEHDYAVESGKREPAVGRIRILAVEAQLLGDITPESVKREGFKTREDFEAHWSGLYGSFDPTTPVWAIVFVPAEEVRLLARDSTRGYVAGGMEALGIDSAGIDRDTARLIEPEPEAVDVEYQRRFSAKAEEDQDRRRAVMRSRLAQLRQVGIEHIKAGRDPGPVLDDALERLQREEAA